MSRKKGQQWGGLSSTRGTGAIWCPFFIAHSATEIHCEGLTEGSKIIQRFRDPAQKDLHCTVFCEGRHRNCEIYCMLMELYKEE